MRQVLMVAIILSSVSMIMMLVVEVCVDITRYSIRSLRLHVCDSR